MTFTILSFIFPFPAEVWGTVSDWFMVGVTGLTAFYLYKTLKSQQEVQRTQNELYKIESIRFKESVKPVLKYFGSTEIFKPSDQTQKIFTIQLTNEASSAALDISKIVSEDRQTQQIFIPTGLSDIRHHLVSGDKPLLYHFSIDSKSHGFVTFTIKYKDVAGTQYEQRVFCICDDFGIEINPSLPKMVS